MRSSSWACSWNWLVSSTEYLVPFWRACGLTLSLTCSLPLSSSRCGCMSQALYCIAWLLPECNWITFTGSSTRRSGYLDTTATKGGISWGPISPFWVPRMAPGCWGFCSSLCSLTWMGWSTSSVGWHTIAYSKRNDKDSFFLRRTWTGGYYYIWAHGYVPLWRVWFSSSLVWDKMQKSESLQGRSVRKERLRLRRYCKLGRSGDSSSGNFFFKFRARKCHFLRIRQDIFRK